MSPRDQLPPLIITFLVVNIIAVGLRVWIRIHIKRSFGVDDAALCLSLIAFILLAILAFICLGYGYGATDERPGYNLMLGVKYFLIVQLVYMITLYLSKLSVGLVLYRLAEARIGVRRMLLASMVVLTVWTAVTVLTVALQCIPLSVAWGEGKGTCVSGAVISNTGYSYSSMDIATSWFYALLPVYLLRSVQLSTKQIVSICILLGLGVVSNIATIIRLKYLIEIRYVPSAASEELIQLYLGSFIYSVTEIGLTMFAASLAALRPLLTFLRHKGTRGSSGDGTDPSHNKSWTRGLRDVNPPIPLHDFPGSDTESQRNILPRSERSIKSTTVNISYTETGEA
ncbi:hypothetical protein VPNG_02632 [Cytospora leucostoma]|uniref:Rhodopsin domain-containing protein n=1 Tax=Cytospora leucostoma TaxID=1230097 RepID=A0A423XI42_9PEZI|nr:hypothetical protein VPNG_02632 [Cytospora leucostoma]